MYLNTVFKYNVFKYCPALVIQLIEGNKIMNGFDHTVLEVPIEINTL